MSEEKSPREAQDPLAMAARICFARSRKATAAALNISLSTADKYLKQVRRIPPRLRAHVARIIIKELDRQEAEERAEARAACRKEMEGHDLDDTRQVEDGNAKAARPRRSRGDDSFA